MRLVSLLHDSLLAGPHDVELVGDVAYVAGKWGAFSAVDVSDPKNPRMLDRVGDRVDNAQTVLPIGDVCLLGTNDLLAIDVSDPESLQELSRIEDDRIQRVNGMVRREHLVYAANKSHVIDVFDVTVPAEPVLVDAFDTQPVGIESPHDVALMGDWLITVDQKKDAALKVQMYRVWDGGPVTCSRWEVVATIDDPRLNGANRVVVDGAFAYVACNYGDAVCAIEVSRDGAMTLRSVVGTCDVAPCGIELGADSLYVGAASHVERFSLADPANPLSVDRLRVFDHDRPRNPKQRGQGDAHDLEWRDGLLYVTGQNDDSLAVVRT